MRCGVFRALPAAILVCAVPLRVDAEQSSLPQLQEEIRGLPLELPNLDGKQIPTVVMNRAVSLNNHYAPHKLVRPTASLRRTSRMPTLWPYGENDNCCGPALSKQMHLSFTAASENTEYKLLPPVGGHGHFLLHSVNAMTQSAPLLIDFLERH
jgi:hypothetical protein